MPPKTKYVMSDGVRLAYQRYGEGDVDLVFVPGLVSHLEMMWGDPAFARFMRRMGQFVRVTTFDRRGIGMSERVSRPTTLEERLRDLQAVMAASGVDDAVVVGFSDGGFEAMLFAATQPHRLKALILAATAPSALADDEQPGFVKPEFRPKLEYLLEHWGDGWNYSLYAPSLAGSAMQRRLVSVFERVAARKEDLERHFEGIEHINVKHCLPAIQAPTLVLMRDGDFVPVESGVFMAERIPNARLVVLDGADHVPFAGDAHRFVREVEDFIRDVGVLEPAPPRPFRTILCSRSQGGAALPLARIRRELDAIARRFGADVRGFHDQNQVTLFAGADTAVLAARSLADLGLACGVHAGEVELTGAEVVGAQVHLAARVAQQARPGQVLASSAVVGLLRTDLHDVVIAGERELKGFAGEHPLFEIAASRVPHVGAEAWSARWPDRIASGLVRVAPWQSRVSMRLARLARADEVPAG